MDFRAVTFYFFAAVMVFAALRVITARNPVHSALFLVLAFFYRRRLVDAAGSGVPGDRAGAGLCRRGHGAVPVRRDDARHQPGPAARGLLGLPRAGPDRRRRDGRGNGAGARRTLLRSGRHAPAGTACGRLQQYARARPAHLHRLRVSLRDRGGHPAGRHRGGHRAHPAPSQGHQIYRSRAAAQGSPAGPGAHGVDAIGKAREERKESEENPHQSPNPERK